MGDWDRVKMPLNIRTLPVGFVTNFLETRVYVARA